METVKYFVLAVFAAYIVKKFIIDPERKLKSVVKKAEERVKIKEELRTNSKPIQSDMYGVNKMNSDPIKFMEEVSEITRQLDNGENVGVDAATAFFLIRNQRHSDLIVGETGTVNFMKPEFASSLFNQDALEERQKRIMEYQPEGRKSFPTNGNVIAPPYVEKVEQLKCGGVRWVYSKWHADECGVSGLCFDKNSRLMPDPDEIKDEPKNKRDNRKDSGSSSRSDDALTDVSKKLSRVLVMQEEYRVDRMLEKGEEQIKDTQDTFKVSSGSDNLRPAEYEDEVKSLEEKYPAPNYEQVMIDDFELELLKDLETSSNVEDDKYHNAIDEEKTVFAYIDEDFFISSVSSSNGFVENLLQELFASSGDGSVFVNFDDKEVYVEKNYFARNIKVSIDEREASKFDRDFNYDNNDNVYDGDKMNVLILSMNGNGYFERISAKGTKMLFNLLLMTQGEGAYYLGWYVKLKFTAHPAIIKFLENHAQSVEVVAANPKDINRRSKLLRDIKKSF